MKQAQLIHKEERIIYLKDGQILDSPVENNPLLHAIFGETKVITTEIVVERWNIKTKREADRRFWDWCESNNQDYRNYYVVITDN